MSFVTRIIQGRGPEPNSKGGNIVIPVKPWQKIVIQQAISDRAQLTGEGKANVVLGILTGEFVPVEGDEGWYIESVLGDAAEQGGPDPYPTKKGIGRAIESAFASLSGLSARDYPFDEAGLPYVTLAAELARENALRLHSKIEYDEARHNLTEYEGPWIIETIEKTGRAVPAEVKAVFGDGPAPLVYPAYQYIIDNWDVLKDFNVFRVLCYIAAATENWPDTAQERMRFTQVCVQVHNARAKWEEMRKAREEQQYRDAVLVSYPMANGDYVKVPGGWKVVELEKATQCTHAGAIEVKNGERYSVPHFLFFLSHPVNEMTEAEEAQILQAANDAWPEGSLSDIKAAEVELEYGENGGITNYEDYLNAPRIGFFEIADAGTYPYRPPANAEVFRTGKEDNN